MKKLRVGTLSLGILLVVMGFVILLAQINQYDIVEQILTWWPVILILIGAEILWQVYTSKEEEPAVKYDTFSMFIIAVLVLFSLGACTLSSAGIMDVAAQALSSADFNLEIPLQVVKTGDNIEEIIINIPGEMINIEKGSDDAVVLFGTASVNAVDRQAAENTVKQTKLVSREEGNKLYVTVVPMPRPTGMKTGANQGKYMLLPSNKKVRIESSQYFELKISSGALECIYLIDGYGKVSMNVPETADLWIKAVVSGSYRLSGNVVWDIHGHEEDESPIPTQPVTGTLQWGDGSHKITILDAGHVEVNEI
jgi:hypothetical protein